MAFQEHDRVSRPYWAREIGVLRQAPRRAEKAKGEAFGLSVVSPAACRCRGQFDRPGNFTLALLVPKASTSGGDPERFHRTSIISLPLPWREGKKGRGISLVGVTPHLTSPRRKGEDLL